MLASGHLGSIIRDLQAGLAHGPGAEA
jgi:hypothetical protein